MAETSLTTPERLAALLEWLGAVLGTDDLRLLEDPRPASNGSSNETAMLRCAWTDPDGLTVERGLVARTAPRADGLFHSYDLDRQYRTMAALADTDVPVPRLIGYGDAAVLGEDFYVMEAAPGEAPPDLPPYTTTGWLFEAEPADQRLVHDRTLDVLARIHRLDVASLDLGFLVDSRPGRGLEDQLDRTEAWFRWAAGDRDQPTMGAVMAWLRDNVPADRPPDGLNWGDARFGNVLYDDLAAGLRARLGDGGPRPGRGRHGVVVVHEPLLRRGLGGGAAAGHSRPTPRHRPTTSGPWDVRCATARTTRCWPASASGSSTCAPPS